MLNNEISSKSRFLTKKLTSELIIIKTMGQNNLILFYMN